jgi:hypothetical protein
LTSIDLEYLICNWSQHQYIIKLLPSNEKPNIPHFTILQKAVRSIDDETWSKINDDLVEFSKMKKSEKGRLLRADTTVVETNIAYPTDAHRASHQGCKRIDGLKFREIRHKLLVMKQLLG